MALFNFGKKKQDAPGQQDGAKEASMSSVRKKDRVLSESTFDTASDLFRRNKLFCVSRDADKLWVGAKMAFSAIGGLSAKDKNDESKGKIINQINDGHIATYFNEKMAAEDCIVFIPTAETVAAMGEYSLLGDKATYELVFFEPSDEGDYSNTGVVVRLQQLQQLHAANQPVSAIPEIAKLLLPAYLDDERDNLDAVDEDDGKEPTFYEQSDDTDDDEDDDDEDDDEDDGYGSGYMPAPQVPAGQAEPDDEPWEGSVGGDGYDYDGGDDGGDLDGADMDYPDAPAGEEPQQVQYIPEETTQRVLARRFFNDDLDTTLTSEGLDQALQASDRYQLELRAPGWLADQYNAMAQLANEELRQLHNQHLTQIRQKYLDAIAGEYQAEMSAVEDLAGDDRYKGCIAERDRILEALPADLEKKRAEMVAAWDQKLKDVGEQARVTAVNQYRDRFGLRHEESLRNLADNERLQVEAATEIRVNEIKAARKREAQVRLDDYNKNLIAKLTEEFLSMSASEKELFERHKAALDAFLNEHREHEISRIKVLEEEQRNSTALERKEREHQARVEGLNKDMKDLRDRMDAELKLQAERAEMALKAKDNEMAYAAKDREREKQAQSARIDKLVQDVGSVTERVRAETAADFERLQAERDDTNRKYDELVAQTKRHSRLLIAAAVLAVIASMCAGLFFGGYLMQRRDLADRQNDVLQRVEDRLDNDGAEDGAAGDDAMDGADDGNGGNEGVQGQQAPAGQDQPAAPEGQGEAQPEGGGAPVQP